MLILVVFNPRPVLRSGMNGTSVPWTIPNDSRAHQVRMVMYPEYKKEMRAVKSLSLLFHISDPEIFSTEE